jgi:cytochrome c biogenesis protein CcdA
MRALYLSFLGVLMLLAGSGLPTARAQGASGSGSADVYLFWHRGCPHCETQIESLMSLAERDGRVRPHYLELGNDANRAAYTEAVERLGVRELLVPLTVVGETAHVGAFGGVTAAGDPLSASIEQCIRAQCVDVVAPLIARFAAVDDPQLASFAIGEQGAASARRDSVREDTNTSPPGAIVRLPWFGELDLRALSLPVLTVVLAAVDGFNPCAMWVLVFLISLLLGQQDRARRWLLGGAFLLTSAIVYYAMVAAWLSLLLLLGVQTWLRIGIGMLALVGGTFYLREYWLNPQAICHVASDSRRHRIMRRMRAAAAEPRFALALVAIVFVAIGVNFIELVCSAGIPAVYTQVLALTPMPRWQHYAWLALYVLVFLADDFVVFALAMLALDKTGLGARYAHHSQLVGGVVLVAVGVLLMLRPDWLLFG